MKITESQLTKIIAESTKKVLEEQVLKSRIKGIVREMLESFSDFSQFEESGDGDDEESSEPAEPKPIHNPDGTSDMNNETKEEQELRNEVEEYFKREGVDIAPYAYKLYGVSHEKGKDTNEMKNARSKFMKCLNHEPNENGYPYSFTSAEINQLKGHISSGNLS